MHLALDGTGADRSPRHEIRDELRGDRVQKLAASRQPELDDVE
jgi:hypothetical protein